MAGQQADMVLEPGGMWSTALARGLIRDNTPRAVDYRDAGFIDLLDAPRRMPAQRTMISKRVAANYERVRRPIMTAVLGMHGLSMSAERERASRALHLGGEQRVLDVACGPGTFTSYFADQLTGAGFVVGLDNSTARLLQAIRDNSHPRAVYMRADPHSLDFDDGTFDAVGCFAALCLIPEPMTVLREMVRVLAPGGRIAVLTTYERESGVARKVLELGATICGVRVFDRTTVPAFLAAAGLIDVEQQLRGITQFVTARRAEWERAG
jgi:ubiquinone/menaquinone biosynthesis C-methylase UbiE